MAEKAIISSACIVFSVAMALFASHVNAISCQDALVKLLPCQRYLVGKGDISVPCCQGANALNQLANGSKQELKTLCECLKKAAPQLGVIPSRAKQLPNLCKIKVPIPIDPNVDCNKV